MLSSKEKSSELNKIESEGNRKTRCYRNILFDIVCCKEKSKTIRFENSFVQLPNPIDDEPSGADRSLWPEESEEDEGNNLFLINIAVGKWL